MEKILALISGILFYPIFRNLPVRRDLWIFGAQDGEAYTDNSKYFFEYVRKNHREIQAVWITRSDKVYEKLNNNGIPVEKNYSLKGVFKLIRAEKIIFCTSRSDLLFAHPKRNRQIINLWHGMPMKKIVYDHKPHIPENKNWRGKLWDKFVVGFQHEDVDFIPSTSNFFTGILKSAFRNNHVFSTGLPRTDVFYKWNKEEIKRKLGFYQEDFIITYMPTHRSYGKGNLNPQIFRTNSKGIEFFKRNNIKVIWKFHKNMVKKLSSNTPKHDPVVFSDFSQRNVDPQEILFISDMLITDYSSCYIDYLFLDRPIGFYLYDNYEKNDNELYFSPKDHQVGEILNEENELLKWIMKTYSSEVEIYPKKSLYHDYYDNKASERVFKHLKK